MNESMEQKKLAECEQLATLIRGCVGAASLCSGVQEAWSSESEKSNAGIVRLTIAATPYWSQSSDEFRSLQFAVEAKGCKGSFTLNIPEFSFGEGQNNAVAMRTLLALLEGFFESLSNEAKAGVIQRMQSASDAKQSITKTKSRSNNNESHSNKSGNSRVKNSEVFFGGS